MSRTRGRPDTTDTRREILDASLELIAERGVRSLSFREVARRADVSHQTPYQYFGSQREILAAIAREGFVGLSESMRAASRAAGEPVDALVAAGVSYVRFALEHEAHFRVMFQPEVWQEGDRELPEAEATKTLLLGLASAVAAAGASALSVTELANVAWSVAHGTAELALDSMLETPGDLGAEHVIEAFARLLA